MVYAISLSLDGKHNLAKTSLALTIDPTPYGPKHVLIRRPGLALSLTPRQDAETPLIRGD